MGKIWQLRTKKKINGKIGAGFIFNVPSSTSSGHPSSDEIKKALESIGGKDAGANSAWYSERYDIIS
ncbi:MAG: hypothetical protein IJU90_04975 [Bacteroidales bacterium]|nr:hypothetical protein [Bacteroidales bacterium]